MRTWPSCFPTVIRVVSWEIITYCYKPEDPVTVASILRALQIRVSQEGEREREIRVRVMTPELGSRSPETEVWGLGF